MNKNEFKYSSEAINWINSCINYKPTWHIKASLAERFGEIINIHFTLDVPNALSSDPTIGHLHRNIRIPKYIWESKEYLTQVIYERIIEIEIHEVKEFFQINKIYFKDPHPELRS